MMNTFIDFIFFIVNVFNKIIYLMVYPLLLIKTKHYKLDNLKIETCDLLNKLYAKQIYNPADYHIRYRNEYRRLKGFDFYNSKTNHVLLSSNSLTAKGIAEIKNIDFKSIQQLQPSISEFLKFKDIKLSADVIFEFGKITSFSLKLNINPKKNAHSMIEEEEVFIEVIIKYDPSFNIISFTKDYYDFAFMHGNRLSISTTETPMSLHEELDLILKEEQFKESNRVQVI